MMSIVPNSGPVSAIVELGGNRLSGNPDHYASVFLGNSICNVRNEQDNDRYGLTYRNSLHYLKCHSTERRAGGWNGSMVQLAYYPGKTWNHSQSLYPVHDWSLAMYELFPGSYCNIINGLTWPAMYITSSAVYFRQPICAMKHIQPQPTHYV